MLRAIKMNGKAIYSLEVRNPFHYFHDIDPKVVWGDMLLLVIRSKRQRFF
jgi:hypothetical protein